MSFHIVRSYIEMIPIIEAEEALQSVTEIALGFGSIEKHESRRIMSEWQRLADRNRAARTRPGNPQQLAAMGIGIKNG